MYVNVVTGIHKVIIVGAGIKIGSAVRQPYTKHAKVRRGSFVRHLVHTAVY
jgi:hypothetical protein